MKKIKLLMLTSLIAVMLVVATSPAFAIIDFTGLYNLSFMGDKNGDNLPDKWHVKGDVVRTCDHPQVTPVYDACAMVFTPSGGGAALWQRIDLATDAWVVQDEAQTEYIGTGQYAAKQMDWERAYYGVRLIYHDGSKIVAYDDIRGGTYHFNDGFFNFYGSFTQDVIEDMADGLVKYYDHGMVTLPHGGYLAVDWVFPFIV